MASCAAAANIRNTGAAVKDPITAVIDSVLWGSECYIAALCVKDSVFCWLYWGVVVSGYDILVEADVVFRNTATAHAINRAGYLLCVGQDIGCGECGFAASETVCRVALKTAGDGEAQRSEEDDADQDEEEDVAAFAAIVSLLILFFILRHRCFRRL